MTEKRRSLAIIPARGGSKGIPHKNMADLMGKPLIHWTIEAAKHSQWVTDCLVSSDDDSILAYAEQQGVVSLSRPAALATDESSTEPVLVHAVEAMLAQEKEYDLLLLLQPTSPLRHAPLIDQAFNELMASDAQALISVCSLSSNPLKCFLVGEEGYLTGIANNQYPFMRRQDLPPVYRSNGAIYLVEMERFRATSRLYQPKTLPFVMSAEDSVDIDGPQDLARAADLLQQRHGE